MATLELRFQSTLQTCTFGMKIKYPRAVPSVLMSETMRNAMVLFVSAAHEPLCKIPFPPAFSAPRFVRCATAYM
jgi:hypothetical protein